MTTRWVMARVAFPFGRQLPTPALRAVGFCNTFSGEVDGVAIATAHIELVMDPEHPTMEEMQGRAQRAFAMLLDVNPADPFSEAEEAS